MLDEKMIYAWFVLATANLVVLGAVVTAIVKLVIYRRALENAQLLRLARWRMRWENSARP